MKKQEFLHELEARLRDVPVTERREMLYDYEEHITAAVENGSSETEAVAKLGNPRIIAKELLATSYIDKAETSATFGNVLRAVVAVIGLGFFNLVIVLGPFLAVIGILIAIYGVAAGFILGPFAEVYHLLFGVNDFRFLDPIFAGFLLVTMEGLGWLLGVAAVVLTKLFGDLSIRYLRLNLRVIKGGK